MQVFHFIKQKWTLERNYEYKEFMNEFSSITAFS
jgi:hypothetical protein